MHLRKALTIGAAALTAGLLALAPNAAQANNPTGGPIVRTMVNGSTVNGTAAFTGAFKSGTASFGGGTFGCTGGTVGGNIVRGTGSGAMTFTSLSIVCSTPLGVNGTLTIGQNCATAAWEDSNVHTGQNPATDIIDTGSTTKVSNVDGSVTLAGTPQPCGTITAGPCTANVQGTVTAQYNEAIKTGSFQDLILNGPGFTLSNQNFFCFGTLSGGVTLNAIDFNINASGGGIDFRNT